MGGQSEPERLQVSVRGDKMAAIVRHSTRGESFAAIPTSRRGDLLVNTMLALRDKNISRSLALEVLQLDAAVFDSQLETWMDAATKAE